MPDSAAAVVRFRVVPKEEGTLLFQLVRRRLPDTSVDAAKELVKAGAVYVGHLRVRVPTVRVVAGERITVYPNALTVEEVSAEAVKIVHRDPSFVILDKPAGVPVAATREQARGTLAEALRRVLEADGLVRPYVGVVHRLDQGASGLVLFTIRDVANKSLHKQFVHHDIERIYRVRLTGSVPEEATCDRPIVERPGGRGVRIAKDGERRAKSAKTTFHRLAPATEMDGTGLCEARLTTGRTHQIRVHAAELGHAVLGDRRYGGEAAAADRLHLHAFQLRFEHPLEGTPVEVTSELPPWAREA